MKRGSTGTWYGRLDRQLILDAALRIAARPGVTEMRFRDLGDELGADPTAVYRHFRSKAHLMSALIDALMADITRTLPADADWRELLRAMATSVLDRFVQHPAIGAHLADSRPVGPGELALVEVSLRAFEDAGLTGDALVEHYGAFSGMLLSYVAMACRELVTAGGSASGGIEGIPWFLEDLESAPSGYPTLSRYAEQLAAMDYRSTYFAGVNVLIAAIESVARSTVAPSV